MHYLLTEPLALMVTSLAMYFIIQYSIKDTKHDFIFAAAAIAFLALIKALLGYVVLVVFILGLVISLFSKKEFVNKIRKLACIFALSFFLCVPYLIYTYHLTGKAFYWATTGGENLYWLTNPTKGEYGFWNSDKRVLRDEQMAHHRQFISSLPADDPVKRDKLLMAAAIENIKTHPAKFFSNWLCNLGRMFFNYPYDYKYQNPYTLLYTIPNSLIFWLTIYLMSLLIFKHRLIRSLPAVIVVLLIFIFAYWFGQSLSAAGPRKMYLVLPIFAVCYCYCIKHFKSS